LDPNDTQNNSGVTGGSVPSVDPVQTPVVETPVAGMAVGESPVVDPGVSVPQVGAVPEPSVAAPPAPPEPVSGLGSVTMPNMDQSVNSNIPTDVPSMPQVAEPVSPLGGTAMSGVSEEGTGDTNGGTGNPAA